MIQSVAHKTYCVSQVEHVEVRLAALVVPECLLLLALMNNTLTRLALAFEATSRTRATKGTTRITNRNSSWAPWHSLEENSDTSSTRNILHDIMSVTAPR